MHKESGGISNFKSDEFLAPERAPLTNPSIRLEDRQNKLTSAKVEGQLGPEAAASVTTAIFVAGGIAGSVASSAESSAAGNKV